MTPQQKAREAMNRVLPELLELKFGCEVEISYGEANPITGSEIATRGRIKALWEEVEEFGIINHFYEVEGLDSMNEIRDDHIAKILGTPPNIGDVLRAINNMMVVVDGNGNFYHLKMKLSDNLPKFDKSKGTVRYNLSAPFTDQSDEFYSFLIDILK